MVHCYYPGSGCVREADILGEDISGAWRWRVRARPRACTCLSSNGSGDLPCRDLPNCSLRSAGDPRGSTRALSVLRSLAAILRAACAAHAQSCLAPYRSRLFRLLIRDAVQPRAASGRRGGGADDGNRGRVGSMASRMGAGAK